MTSRPDDEPRLERKLRDALRRRDPGPAPLALRERVLDVPDLAGRPGVANARRGLSLAMGIAATILVLVLGTSIVANLGGTGIAGTSPVPSAGQASPAALPAFSFDPTLEGLGIVASSSTSAVPLLTVLAVVVLGVLAVTLRRWWRLLPVGGVVLCLGYAAVATQAPVELGTFGYGPGLNVVGVTLPPGTQEAVFYERAPAGGRFSFPLLLSVRSSVPVRVEGLYDPSFHDGIAQVLVLTAVWSDGDPNGGDTGPSVPFVPVEVSDWNHTLWIVGRAGACAVGPSVDPASPPTDAAYTWIDSVTLQTSVLGWPRTVTLPLPFRLVEFDTPNCDAASPLTGMPSPSPSTP